MKITRIHIEDFHQFKNLDIDLTYPKGHEKEGQSLEKICFIGQSGCGKTKMLDFIAGNSYNREAFFFKYSFQGNENNFLTIKNFDLTYEQWINIEMDSSPVTVEYNVRKYKTKNNDLKSGDFLKLDNNYIKDVKPNLIYYPAEIKYEITEDKLPADFKQREVIDFSWENASAIWNLILNDIQKYQEEELRIRQEISRVVENKKSDLKAIKKSLKALEDWQSQSFNPIADIAEKCLDPILEKFHLRVKTKLDIQKKEDIGFIKIEDLNGNEIPYDLWSTGTKQVVLSALPLYLLKPKHTLILFDEPERSLYPDLQREIINYYKSLTTDCQLFFATHSPIIASCFEPWEIIELKFDKDGFVYQDKYFEGERHVDNYTINPNYLTYDLILSKVFDLKETYPAIRDEKLNEVLMLRNQLEKLKKEDKLSSAGAKGIYNRYMKLAKQLSWEFELPTYEEAR